MFIPHLFTRRASRRSLPWACETVVAWAWTIALAGCGPAKEDEAASAGRHAVAGTVISANTERQALLVDHDEIPGVMPPMTMEFKVSSADLANARPGMRIRASMYRSADGYHLEQIWPADAAAEEIIGQAAKEARLETMSLGRNAVRQVGENLPDFALYDQSGAVVQARRFRGRQIVLNFIFTRCPDAKMCPAATARMMQVQRLAQQAGVDNLELISVSLEPEYDSPGVLREYAEVRGIDTANFSFLTGPEGAIKDLLFQIGVDVLQQGPLLQHTLATVLIDEAGKIVHRVDGSSWEAEDFVGRLHRPDAARANPSAK